MTDDKSRGDDPGGFQAKEAHRKTRRGACPLLGPDFVFDYKDVMLRCFLTDGRRSVPRRISGLRASQQRALTWAIKVAGNIALLPYTSNGN